MVAPRVLGAGAVVALALPLVIGWHPPPTLGTLAETVGVFSVALVLLLLAWRKSSAGQFLWLGTSGLLVLLLIRCVAQGLSGQSAYDGFWFGPMAVLATALALACLWDNKSDLWITVVAKAVLVGALVNAVVGFSQYWRLFGGLESLSPYWVYLDASDHSAVGNVAQRNILASLSLLGIAATIYLYPKKTFVVGFAEFFLAYVVSLTASRTPLLIVFVVIIFYFWRTRRVELFFREDVVRRLVFPLLLMQVITPMLNEVLRTIFDLSPAPTSIARIAHGLGVRPLFYQLAAEIGMNNWLVGMGWKSLAPAMIEQGFLRQLWGTNELPTHAHNILLHLWAENGVFIGLLATLYPIWLIVSDRTNDSKRDFARLCLLVLTVHSWVEFPLWQPVLLFLYVALLRTLEVRVSSSPSVIISPTWFRVGLAALTVGAAITVKQLIDVAKIWEQRIDYRVISKPVSIDPLRMNPVVEPYADWLELNANRGSPAERIQRLERLSQWVPDSMMLGLLIDAYLAGGRIEDARRISRIRLVVFGEMPQRARQLD